LLPLASLPFLEPRAQAPSRAQLQPTRHRTHRQDCLPTQPCRERQLRWGPAVRRRGGECPPAGRPRVSRDKPPPPDIRRVSGVAWPQAVLAPHGPSSQCHSDPFSLLLPQAWPVSAPSSHGPRVPSAGRGGALRGVPAKRHAASNAHTCESASALLCCRRLVPGQ
jgi:hypothetical protein